MILSVLLHSQLSILGNMVLDRAVDGGSPSVVTEFPKAISPQERDTQTGPSSYRRTDVKMGGASVTGRCGLVVVGPMFDNINIIFHFILDVILNFILIHRSEVDNRLWRRSHDYQRQRDLRSGSSGERSASERCASEPHPLAGTRAPSGPIAPASTSVNGSGIVTLLGLALGSALLLLVAPGIRRTSVR